MAGNTFTKAFVINRFVQHESRAKPLLFMLEEDQVSSITNLKTHGIKKYFVNHFHENVDTNIIDDVFELIVNTFPKQYNLIVSYKKSKYLNSKEYYK